MQMFDAFKAANYHPKEISHSQKVKAFEDAAKELDGVEKGRSVKEYSDYPEYFEDKKAHEYEHQHSQVFQQYFDTQDEHDGRHDHSIRLHSDGYDNKIDQHHDGYDSISWSTNI